MPQRTVIDAKRGFADTGRGAWGTSIEPGRSRPEKMATPWHGDNRRGSGWTRAGAADNGRGLPGPQRADPGFKTWAMEREVSHWQSA